jgi:hypothetical protein
METEMKRITATLPLLLATLAVGCKGTQNAGGAAATPPPAAPVSTPATDAPEQPTGGLMGAPGFAQRGVDSANAVQQRQLDSVNALAGQASGASTQP